MSTELSIGDKLYLINRNAQAKLFKSAELMQFAYEAFQYAVNNFGQSIQGEFEFNFPLGVYPDGSQIVGIAKHTKDSFIEHNVLLAETALPIQGIYGLVTTMETALNSFVKEICKKYPQKLPKEKQISAKDVLSCDNIDSVKEFIIGDYIHELSYKSPKEYAKSIELIIGINLLEIPEFHQYIECKATRDIHIHNNGIANEIYIKKSESHARVAIGMLLPVTNQYYLLKYESSLKILENLMKSFHEIWTSEQYTSQLNSKSAQQADAPEPLTRPDNP